MLELADRQQCIEEIDFFSRHGLPVRAFYTRQNNYAVHTGASIVTAIENRQALQERLQLPAAFWLKQVHGTQVHEFDGNYERNDCVEADAAISVLKGHALGVLTADCLPILLANDEQVAVVHAGWRGLLAGVIEEAMARFAKPAIAWIGPAIQREHFEVGVEVYQAFTAKNQAWASHFQQESQQKYLASLSSIAEDVLRVNACVTLHNSRLCTYQDTSFFSYRRDNTLGRNACIISLS